MAPSTLLRITSSAATPTLPERPSLWGGKAVGSFNLWPPPYGGWRPGSRGGIAQRGRADRRLRRNVKHNPDEHTQAAIRTAHPEDASRPIYDVAGSGCPAHPGDRQPAAAPARRRPATGARKRRREIGR